LTHNIVSQKYKSAGSVPQEASNICAVLTHNIVSQKYKSAGSV